MLRRFLVLIALMFWQSGFTFYAVVVVPAGMSVLRPPTLQAFVTQVVSRYLNLAGGVALVLLAIDILWTCDPSGRRFRLRWLLWGLMATALVGLVWLHPRLGALMDETTQTIPDREALYPLHRVYLLISAAQWLCATIFIWMMLGVWREEDGGREEK